MKKAITFILAAAIMLSLAACGGTKTSREPLSANDVFEQHFTVTTSLIDYTDTGAVTSGNNTLYTATGTLRIDVRPKNVTVNGRTLAEVESMRLRVFPASSWTIEGSSGGSAVITLQGTNTYSGTVDMTFESLLLHHQAERRFFDKYEVESCWVVFNLD